MDSMAADESMTNVLSSEDVALLAMLAEGVDPVTGEVLPSEHLLQHPRIVRALLHSVHALERQRKVAKRGVTLPGNAGARWTKQKDADFVSAFDAATSVPEIARKHGRTKGAITSRLVRLGKIAVPVEPNTADDKT